MSGGKKRIVLVSGSPKVDQSQAVSALLVKRGEAQIQDERLDVQTIPVRHVMMHRNTEHAFRQLLEADAIVFIFPLYFFCLPAMLTRFLQDFAAAYPRAEKNANVYAMINCGFPEAEASSEAIRVVEQFAKKTGRTFRGGLLIGCGGMMLGTQGAPFLRSLFEQVDGLFQRIKDDQLHEEAQPPRIELTAAKFPRTLYYMAGNAGWKSTARKNRIKIKDLYRKPYSAQ